jgi:hypothetical protein
VVRRYWEGKGNGFVTIGFVAPGLDGRLRPRWFSEIECYAGAFEERLHIYGGLSRW